MQGGGGLALDVWEGEPNLPWKELENARLWIKSPHVAGYSREAKLRATEMLYAQLIQAWEGKTTFDKGREEVHGAKLERRIQVDLDGHLPGGRALAQLLSQIVDIEGDSRALMTVRTLHEDIREGEFEALRRRYSLRREFSSYSVRGVDPTLEIFPGFLLKEVLEKLGFHTSCPQS